MSRRDDYRRRGDSYRGYRGGGRRRDRDDYGGAGHLARIHGTEQDRVNCPFYFKIGACRHGEKCDRMHNKPAFSPTILVPHMYQNPLATAPPEEVRMSTHRRSDPDFEEFFIDVFEEVSKFGEIDDIAVCDNFCDHLFGNVYIQFFDEEDADKCVKGITGRYFAGKLLSPEFSPVTDFRTSRCRQYDRNECQRGGNCNYMHIKKVPRDLNRDLARDQPHYGERSRRGSRRSRSRSR